MEVNCIPGASGGLPQHFVLEVHGSLENSKLLQQIPQSDQGVAGTIDTSSSAAPLIHSEDSKEPNFQVYGLQPGYDYTIVVYAVNSQGRSQPVLIENIRISESVQRSHFLGALPNVVPNVSGLENAFIIVGLISELDFLCTIVRAILLSTNECHSMRNHRTESCKKKVRDAMNRKS